MRKEANRCRPKRQHVDCRLLLPIFYYDGVETQRLHGKQNNAIYFCLGNAPTTELLSSASKVCLCIVPDGADIIEALEAVVIQHLHTLEWGIRFWFTSECRYFWCYGSAYAILGDHPALAKIAGIIRFLFCIILCCC